MGVGPLKIHGTMKKILIALLAFSAAFNGALAAEAREKRPNILFVFSDDQRADTIHALGNEAIETPNLDTLVHRGTAFTRAYYMGGMQGAVCVPSRAMLMTGRSVFRINENMHDQGTWPEAFGTSGYETYATGKWHNGAESLLKSFQTGRAIFMGGMGDPYSIELRDISAEHKLEKRVHEKDKHAVELIADGVVDFLKTRKRDKPFLAYVAMDTPHDPRIAPKEYHAKYNAAMPPLPSNYLPQHPIDNGEMRVRDEKLEAWPRKPEAIRQHLADYYACITFMDAQMGRIFAELKESGQDTNTIIVFSADQGLAIGSHGLMGKQNLYEDSVRVPLIVAGPGISAEKKSDAFVYLLDVFPTLGEMANVKAPEGSEGISFAPILMGKAQTIRDGIFSAYKNVQRAVRDERWKFIRYPQIATSQLFDLQNDPDEKNDLAGKPEFAEKLKEMRGQLERAQKVFADTCAFTGANPGKAEWSPNGKK